jgi:hypothetical protein
MCPDDHERAVLNAVSRKTGIPVYRLSLEDRLLQDLGIDGDDAAELLMDVSRAHGLDLSGLEFDRHFRSEPSLFSIFRYPSAKQRELAEKAPITIADMIRAVRAGRWFE